MWDTLQRPRNEGPEAPKMRGQKTQNEGPKPPNKVAEAGTLNKFREKLKYLPNF